MPTTTPVLVLGGGPDAEREVSIKSATGIASALKQTGLYDVRLEIIDTLTLEQLKKLPGEVIVPYLHGPWGEGGPLQDVIELDGRPFVGSNARASRACMDKVNTKAVALEHGIPTAPVWILNPRDKKSPCPLPVVLKPVHEGSTVGLHVCTTHEQYASAAAQIEKEWDAGVRRMYMIEPKIGGQVPAGEITVGLLDGDTLPLIEIVPKNGLYDYEAKYVRDDTEYLVDPDLPEHLVKKMERYASKLFKVMGCRHIARADFMLERDGSIWMLEINTTPGFTDHSLVPKAARAAGIEMPELCDRLVKMALRDAVKK